MQNSKQELYHLSQRKEASTPHEVTAAGYKSDFLGGVQTCAPAAPSPKAVGNLLLVDLLPSLRSSQTLPLPPESRRSRPGQFSKYAGHMTLIGKSTELADVAQAEGG